jgi:small subunit ribosomal protein S6
MFLLDNQVVREDWKRAKGLVTGLVEKSGGKVVTARRWDERRLAYPIQKKRRATYLLAHFDLGREGSTTFVRDLELSEPILRHLILRVEAVPESEHELARAEEAADFSFPTPPGDDAEEEAHAAEQRPEDLEEDAGDDEGPHGRGRRRREALVEAEASGEED